MSGVGLSSWEYENYRHIQHSNDFYNRGDEGMFDLYIEALGTMKSNAQDGEMQRKYSDAQQVTSHTSNPHWSNGTGSPLDTAKDGATKRPSKTEKTSAGHKPKLFWTELKTPESMRRQYGLDHDSPEGSGSSHAITTLGRDMQSRQMSQNDKQVEKGVIRRLGDYPPSIREQILSSAKTRLPEEEKKSRRKSISKGKRRSLTNLDPTQRADMSDQLTRLLQRKKDYKTCYLKDADGKICTTTLEPRHLVSSHILAEAKSWLEVGFEQNKLGEGLPWIFRNREMARLAADYLLVCGVDGCFETFTQRSAVKDHRKDVHRLKREIEDPAKKPENQEWRFELFRLLKAHNHDEDEPRPEDKDDGREMQS